MAPEKLAYMANQIGRFFTSQRSPDDEVAAAIADHLMKFWDLRMRRTLLAHRDAVALDPTVRLAVEQMAGSDADDAS